MQAVAVAWQMYEITHNPFDLGLVGLVQFIPAALFSDMISVVIRMTLIQLETTDDMRGRVSAVNSLFVIASNQLGDFLRRPDGGVARHHSGGAGRRRRRAFGGADREKGFRAAVAGRKSRHGPALIAAVRKQASLACVARMTEGTAVAQSFDH
jgi:hypothetical protein